MLSRCIACKLSTVQHHRQEFAKHRRSLQLLSYGICGQLDCNQVSVLLLFSRENQSTIKGYQEVKSCLLSELPLRRRLVISVGALKRAPRNAFID